MSDMIPEILTPPVVAAVSSAIAAIASAIAAWKAINLSKKYNSIMMILTIENQMNERKAAFDQASTKLRQANIDKKSQEEKTIIADYYDTTKENYFNILDRLCFCILKDYLPNKDWTSEYRNLLNDTIKDFKDDFNPSTSPYKNIIDLNNKWQRS